MFLAYLGLFSALLSAAIPLSLLDAERTRFAVERLAARWARYRRLPVTEIDEIALQTLIERTSFAALGMSGLAMLTAGLTSLLSGRTTVAQWPLGLPWLDWHLQLDPLAGLFLSIIGVGVVAVALYGPGYVRGLRHGSLSFTTLGATTGLFVAGMELVVLANDAFVFMIAWEVMSVASYVLVAYQHEHAANRRASFLYLLMAVVGAIALILAYGVVAAFAPGLTFDALRAAPLSPGWASLAFTLALIGFGMKAGLVPLHAWLPEAHPVAPSHISALMSGVMLKVAAYGFLRFVFDILGEVHWQWGATTLLLGTLSAALGALYAYQQNDLKRLLAYSSIENIGIIFMGFGLSLIFLAKGQQELAVIGLVAGLYHAANHATFKTLLFLLAGTILHQAHEANLERMGGLIKHLPRTAALMLIASLAISGLPPLNGFVSEWLTFQTALQGSALDSGILRSFVPVAAALLAFTGAVTAATFVKAFGVGFLGLPRSRHAAHAREPLHTGMWAGPVMLATLCALLGLFPGAVIAALGSVTQALLGTTLSSAYAHGWLWLTPVSSGVASYSAPAVMLACSVAGWFGYRWLRSPRLNPVRESPRWDCGFGGLDARMQYTSSAFSQPLRRVFHPLYETREATVTKARGHRLLTPADLDLELLVDDRSWRYAYLPLGRSVETAARQIGRIQTGNIRTYIAYSFFTLIFLLAVVS